MDSGALQPGAAPLIELGIRPAHNMSEDDGRVDLNSRNPATDTAPVHAGFCFRLSLAGATADTTGSRAVSAKTRSEIVQIAADIRIEMHFHHELLFHAVRASMPSATPGVQRVDIPPKKPH
jgi:hypothetical protein